MHVITVPLPNADGQRALSAGEVRALIGLIQRTCARPDHSRQVSLDMIATALGVARGTLYAWMREPIRTAKRHLPSRGIPYSAFYCLQVMATNPAAARADVFEPMWARIAPPRWPRTDPAPGTP